jgi:hypothetical protein
MTARRSTLWPMQSKQEPVVDIRRPIPSRLLHLLLGIREPTRSIEGPKRPPQLIYSVDEMPPIGSTLVLALQHVFVRNPYLTASWRALFVPRRLGWAEEWGVHVFQQRGLDGRNRSYEPGNHATDRIVCYCAGILPEAGSDFFDYALSSDGCGACIRGVFHDRGRRAGHHVPNARRATHIRCRYRAYLWVKRGDGARALSAGSQSGVSGVLVRVVTRDSSSGHTESSISPRSGEMQDRSPRSRSHRKLRRDYAIAAGPGRGVGYAKRSGDARYRGDPRVHDRRRATRGGYPCPGTASV